MLTSPDLFLKEVNLLCTLVRMHQGKAPNTPCLQRAMLDYLLLVSSFKQTENFGHAM